MPQKIQPLAHQATQNPEYPNQLTPISRNVAAFEADAAVNGLRRAAVQDYLIRGLLTRAWLWFVPGKQTGSMSAQSDLDEAWEIAERGSMKLFMADIHHYRGRLFGRGEGEVW